MNFLKRILRSKWLGFLIFYGWNVFYIITLITLESSERVFSELVYNVFTSYTPVHYLWITGIMCFIPFFCLFVGWKWLDNDRNRLLKWFYGFQVPLSFLMLFRLGGFNEVTPEILMYFVLLTVPVIGYGTNLLWGKKIPASLNTVFRVFQVVVGLGVAMFLLIYILPITWIILRELIENLPSSRDLLEMGFVAAILSIFFLLTGTLTIFFPLALIKYYMIDGSRELSKAWKTDASSRLIGLVSVALVVFLIYPREQPQEFALKVSKEWLDGTVSNEEMLHDQERIKEGLINAYLWRYRYIGRTENNYNGVGNLYEEAFDSEANWIIDVHDFLINPFVYHGGYSDKSYAAEYYEQLFDTPMERAEKDHIIEAMRNSFELRRVEANILDIDQKQVEVTDRDIEFKQLEDGVVEVMFHERYENRTYRQQEVFYYFSVPENTVVTGMWLGDTDEQPRLFPYTIAPRGAAQKAYKAVVQRRQDPSLLEQVGPYQYRLRIFPIPGRDRVRFSSDRKEKEPRPMHITLRLLTKADENGHIELPELTEKRNVFWEPNTLLGCAEDEWFPSIERKFEPSKTTTTAFFDGTKLSISPVAELPTRTVDDAFTVVVDGSYSMNEHAEKLKVILDDFRFKNNVEVLILNGDSLIEAPLPFGYSNFIGNNYPMKHLSKWQTKHPERRLLWITDKGSYELLQEDSVYKASKFSEPIDVLHLNGYAAIYDDAFVETVLTSGGNVYTDIDSWIQNVKLQQAESQTAWYENGNQYLFEQTDFDGDDDPFTAFYASRLAMASNRNKANVTVEDMDQLHELAKKHSFVSPYSSMICLVSEEQRRLLEELSARKDRFERIVETGKVEGNLNLMASPEPHEWALMIAALMLFTFLYRERIRILYSSYFG